MENIPCKNGAPAHARGRRNLWSIYPLHTPHKGPGSRLSAGQRLFPATDAPAASPIPATRSRPADAAALSSGPSRPPAYETAADMPRPEPPSLPRAATRRNQPHMGLPAIKKDRHPTDDGFFTQTVFSCPVKSSPPAPAIAVPPQQESGTEAVYFFRASESTMAWAWASSTVPASRTSTCRSAPRASTPRMGMFPAWPCIS